MIKTLAIIGLVIGVIGLIFSFLPLGLIAIIPAAVGLLFSLIALFLSRNSEAKKTLVYAATIICIAGITIAGVKELATENKVVDDPDFKKKVEESVDEVSDDLEDALDDIEE